MQRSRISTPLLTAREETDLGIEVQTYRDSPRGRAARDTLVTRNLSFVIVIARRYFDGRNNDDFLSAGNQGLIEAAKRYDPAEHQGVRFTTYAAWWIRLEIRKEIQKLQLVRTPYYMRSRKVMETYLLRPGRRLEKTESTFLANLKKAQAAARKPQSFASMVERRDRETPRKLHGDRPECADPRRSQACEASDTSEGIEDLAPLLAMLSPMEFNVLDLRFGLLSREPTMTQREVGRRLGITREWVSRVEQKALGVLRAAIALDKNHCAFAKNLVIAPETT